MNQKPRILFIVLKRKYFEQILSGEKLEEYRIINRYWIIKLINQHYDKIIFQEGYTKSARRIIATYHGYTIKKIKHEHFSKRPVSVFAIQFRANP